MKPYLSRKAQRFSVPEPMPVEIRSNAGSFSANGVAEMVLMAQAIKMMNSCARVEIMV